MEKGIYELSGFQFRTLRSTARSGVGFYVLPLARQEMGECGCPGPWVWCRSDKRQQLRDLVSLGLLRYVTFEHKDLIQQSIREDKTLYEIFDLTDAGFQMFRKGNQMVN